MDILTILKTQPSTLYKEDLDFFLEELETGDYPNDYVNKCKIEIQSILTKFENYKKIENLPLNFDSSMISTEDLKSQKNNEIITDEQKFFKDLIFYRKLSNYKEKISELFNNNKILNINFIKENVQMFNEEELNLLLSFFKFDEDFLENYFNIFDKKIFSKTQIFSEEFFMKHYSELSIKDIFESKINDWTIKEKRSSKLDLFLRLKGVKL